MIQRLQTVWLFLSGAVLFSLFLFPYVHFVSADGIAKEIKVTGVYEVMNGQSVQTEPFLLLTIATVVVAFVPIALIFLYKNRKQQIMMCYISLVILIAHYYWLVKASKPVTGDIQLQIGNFGIGAILPSIAMLFILLAIRGIRRDEKLIRSADRLR